MEIAKQDEALTDLSALLGELKNMAVDMGTAIERFSIKSLYMYTYSLRAFSFLKATL
jgi:hypothetical protein